MTTKSGNYRFYLYKKILVQYDTYTVKGGTLIDVTQKEIKIMQCKNNSVLIPIKSIQQVQLLEEAQSKPQSRDNSVQRSYEKQSANALYFKDYFANQ